MNFAKVCPAVVLLLAFIAATVFGNAAYLDNTATHIVGVLDCLPDDTESAAQAVVGLRDCWEERKGVLCFTLSDASLEKISLLFDELLISIENGDRQEYQKTTARLKRAVESINDLEKIFWENIF